MNHLPTIKQLRYFVNLVQHEHFGRAAEASYVSQSAFSVAIKELEALIGLQLVDRTNKQVTVTEAGREFASGARRILEQLEELVTAAQGQATPLGGKLKLGVIPTIAPFLVPGLLQGMRRDYPQLKLYLVEDLTQRLYERLMLGEIDLILLALPYDMRGVEVLSLFEDHFLLAHREQSHWIENEKTDPELLESDAVLLLEDGHCLRDHAIAACKLKQGGKVSQFSASSLFTLVQMVDEDLGITYLPEMALDSPLLTDTHIITRPMPDDSYREIGLAWRQGSARAPEFRLLGEYLTALPPSPTMP